MRSRPCPIIRRVSLSGAASNTASLARTDLSASMANGGARDAEITLLRDYYRVETVDGARYWLFRDGAAGEGGKWWLHGVGEA